MAAYEDDLAYIHHAGFGAFAEAEVKRVLPLLKQHRRVTELGCGSGIATKALTRAGHVVTALDASPAMIRLAKKTAPKARFAVASFTKPIPPADAVVAVGEVFNYGRHDLAKVFRSVHRALAPHGVFTFDFAGPGRGGPEKTKRYWLGPDWAILVKRETKGRTLTRTMTTFRKIGVSYRRGHETHVQTLYAPAQMLALLRTAGFTAQLRAAIAPGHYGVTARKERRDQATGKHGVRRASALGRKRAVARPSR